MKAAHSSLFLINPPKNYYSKQLTKYDTELTFDKKLKHFLRIHKKSNIFNSKELNNIFNQTSKDTDKNFNRIKSKINITNKKTNLKSFSPLNEFAKQKRISYLPKISPYILSNKTSILIDYNKAFEMGSEGFKDLCDNESKNIKEILFAYNDHNFKSLKDFNSFSYFNKVNEDFGDNNDGRNISKVIKGKNKVEKNYNNLDKNKNDILLENQKQNNIIDNLSKNNIFDENFMKRNKMSKIKKKLLKKLERIKNQNNKVVQSFIQHKKNFLKKKIDNRQYRINYNSIEKHTPYTNLNSKSRRFSPEDMVHTNYNSVHHKKKIIFDDKKINTKNENKEKFYVTSRSINLCSGKYNFSL